MPDPVVDKEAPAEWPTPARCLACPAFHKLLLVEEGSPDPGLEGALRSLGLQVSLVPANGNALAQVHERDGEFLLWCAHHPCEEQARTLRQLRGKCPALPVLVVVKESDAESVIEFMHAGAHDILTWPCPPEELRHAVSRVREVRRLLCGAALLPECPRAKRVPHQFIGSSVAMQEVYKQIGLVARRDEPVLIRGETGTGKELVARAIHEHGRQQRQRFEAVNCAALPEPLLESELFGHEAGAFTGAVRRHIGAFERAHGGTLFLDEIGDTSLPLQAKLLRVLQEGVVRRVGGAANVELDVRIVAATNRDLESSIRAGRFREDLFYRLNVVSIRTPALRERPGDIAELAEHFLDRYTAPGEFRPTLGAEALSKLRAYDWPGNVRELENCVRRALVLAKGPAILARDILLVGQLDRGNAHVLAYPLPLLSLPHSGSEPADRAGGEECLDQELRRWLTEQVVPDGECGLTVVERVERKLLRAALRQTEGNQVQAARLLGISRSTLREWINKYERRAGLDGARVPG